MSYVFCYFCSFPLDLKHASSQAATAAPTRAAVKTAAGAAGALSFELGSLLVPLFIGVRFRIVCCKQMTGAIDLSKMVTHALGAHMLRAPST